jgi:hypothetical protein
MKPKIGWVQQYVLDKMSTECLPPTHLNLNENYKLLDAFNNGRWAMMQELASEELKRIQKKQAIDNNINSTIVHILQENLFIDYEINCLSNHKDSFINGIEETTNKLLKLIKELIKD